MGKPQKVFVTHEEVKEAEENGISRSLLIVRLLRGWDRLDAIYHPKKKKRSAKWLDWQYIAEKNGVDKRTFEVRISRKDGRFFRNPELAARTPKRRSHK
jgi:hypothetical protein